MGFHYGDVFEGVARALDPQTPALVHGALRRSWGEIDARSNRLARALLAGGLAPGEKVAHYLRNHPAYLETFIGASKARLAHVNVNYRYRAVELEYLIDNSDARAVVFGEEFADEVEALRRRLPQVKLWIEVGNGSPRVAGAVGFETLAGSGDAAPLDLERSPDDLHLIYTGGTTGLPKGVMWRHGDLWEALGGGGSPSLGIPPARSLEEHYRRIAADPSRPVQLPLNPLMHGAALMTAVTALAQGGCVITLTAARFNAAEALQAIATHRVTHLAFVGDVFARPLLEALESEPGRYDLSSLRVMVSTGAMWSKSVKDGLARHAPGAVLYDALGSTESVGYGAAYAGRGAAPGETARFRLGANARVLDARLRELAPGSPQPGYIARFGPVPLGYHKDPERTARTFPVIDGVRHAIPGDLCFLAPDGTVTLLGRGSGCINTGGEKVFAEEVEESLKRHAAVRDALVFGLPSERWGEAVAAVVELRPGTRVGEEALRAHVRAELAPYKAPKGIAFVESIARAPNGKPDYAAARAAAVSRLGPSIS